MHQEFTQFIWWMRTKCWVAVNPETKPTEADDCESADKGSYHSHSPSPFIISQIESWYSSQRGVRLSWSRHCSKGVQPMPKAVYRSGCRNKYNCPLCDLKQTCFLSHRSQAYCHSCCHRAPLYLRTLLALYKLYYYFYYYHYNLTTVTCR